MITAIYDRITVILGKGRLWFGGGMHEINDELTERIIGCCFKVHRDLGPGFIEKIYQNALIIELDNSIIGYEREKTYNVTYSNMEVGKLRVDLLVEGKVILELKSLEGNIPGLFENQLASYLKAAKLNTGLLVNFGAKSCQLRRILNNHRNQDIKSL